MKTLPFNNEKILEITEKYGTPFYIYDEKAIRENVRNLISSFSWCDFKEYFAVKSNSHSLYIECFKRGRVRS